jgi:hypothetical protein
MRRRKRFTTHLARQMQTGAIGLAEEPQPEDPEDRPPLVAYTAADGTLRLETRPAMRHWREE